VAIKIRIGCHVCPRSKQALAKQIMAARLAAN